MCYTFLDVAGPDRTRDHVLIANERAAAIDRLALAVDGFAECPAMDVAAQRFCEAFYGEFPDTTLVRVFGTVPFANLGERERRFVGALSTREGQAFALDDGAPVLTLFGTRGIEPDWNDRLASRDHLAIPLASEEFVAEIPMISRLLSQLGFASIRARNGTWQFVSRLADGGEGLFFVGDARTATDERGRLIIPAADFVDRYGVRTVFGFGGEAASQSMMLAAIVFCRSVLPREEAERFVPLFGRLRDATAALLRHQSLFANGS